jgi:hypothetical protein
MENSNPVVLSEILFGSANPSESKRIQQLVRKGLAYKIAPRVYTTNLADNTHAIVKRNWFRIIAHLYPGAGTQPSVGVGMQAYPYWSYFYNPWVYQNGGITWPHHSFA